jgi:hypothetical protein
MSKSAARPSLGQDRGLNRRDFEAFQTDSKDLIAALLLRRPVAGPFVTRGGTRPRAFHDHERRSKMKRWLTKATLLAAIALPALSGTAGAGGADDYGCSNATLKGEYAFGVLTVASATGPGVVAGIKVFDGQGNLKQRDYQGDNNAGPDFSPPGRETGTYTVNSDCTGSMVINLNALGVPPVPTQGGVINIMFVIADGGRHIHEVVSQFIPPGASGPVSGQTSADDWKVAAEQDH